jgi:hypothetical protein
MLNPLDNTDAVEQAAATRPAAQPFAQYFTAAEPLRRHHEQGGTEGGSDGTSTHVGHRIEIRV